MAADSLRKPTFDRGTRTSADGCVLMVTSGRFADTEPERGLSGRQAASEKPDGQVWVDMVRSVPRRPVLRIVLNRRAVFGVDRELGLPAKSGRSIQRRRAVRRFGLPVRRLPCMPDRRRCSNQSGNARVYSSGWMG